MMTKKELYLLYVKSTIKENPEWLADTINTMQEGIAEALLDERCKSSDLAYALSVMVDKHPKTVISEYGHIINGIDRLLNFFKGTEFANNLERIIKK